MEVRLARSEDAHWIALQLRDFSNFFISELPLYKDDEHSLNVINDVIDNHLMFIAINDDNIPVGLIAGQISRHAFNPDITTLHELWWWVAEEHRGSRAGSMLLDAYTKWGEAHVNWTICTLEANSPVRDEALYKRGYKKMETNYFIEKGV